MSLSEIFIIIWLGNATKTTTITTTICNNKKRKRKKLKEIKSKVHYKVFNTFTRWKAKDFVRDRKGKGGKGP